MVVLSNRGPLSFRRNADGALVTRRGAGGLVSTLGPAVAGRGATWLAAAIGEPDRAAAEHARATSGGRIDADGYAVSLLDVDEAAYKLFYEVIANRTLWFAYHGLDDLSRSPSLDRRWHEAFDAYVSVNHGFAVAAAAAAPERATVLVHDLHLSLVGPRLASLRPDVRIAHFSHTPFCWPDGLAVLPSVARRTLLDGMAGHRACGFHSVRWARAFSACAAVELQQVPTTFVSPAAIDPHDVCDVAASPACVRHLAELNDAIGDRRLIVRVDRMELSKNILRGFAAYDLLLREQPAWRERVVFAALCYPSREALPEYAAYRDAVITAAEDINERWGSASWAPIRLVTEDDFPRSVAALRRADVALVNPVRDGLNVVAKELTAVNERNAVLCLSPEAGVWDELGGNGALAAPPFDIVGQAEALHAALEMSDDERRIRFAALRTAALARTPTDWLADQLAAAT